MTPIPRYAAACSLVRQRTPGNGRSRGSSFPPGLLVVDGSIFLGLLASAGILPNRALVGPGIELASLERELLGQPVLKTHIQLVPAPRFMPLPAAFHQGDDAFPVYLDPPDGHEARQESRKHAVELVQRRHPRRGIGTRQRHVIEPPADFRELDPQGMQRPPGAVGV